MHRKNGRPVRKCGKCKLNFKTHCGLFANPHEIWNKHRKCPGYLSEVHYHKYLKLQETRLGKLRSKPSVYARRQDAKLRHTEPHYDGLHPTRPKKGR